MKKNGLLLLVFALLGGAAFYFLKAKKSGASSASVDMNFAIDDVSKIEKATLADRLGKHVSIEKKNGKWFVDGQHLIRPSAMETFFETIQKIRVKYVPPHAAVPNMLKNLASEGIRVDIFGAKNELLKTYYVGGVTTDDRGTFVMMDGSDQPYVAHIPFFEGQLRTRFSTDAETWRDRTLFALAPEDIESVAVEYPQFQMESFRLEKQGAGKYAVGPFYPSQPRIQKDLTKGKVESYLLGFEKTVAEALINSDPKRDSVLAYAVPFAKITVKTSKNGEQKAIFYPVWSVDKNGQAVAPSNSNPFYGQVERYNVRTEPSGDFWLTQHVVFGKLFAQYGWFFLPHSGDLGMKN